MTAMPQDQWVAPPSGRWSAGRIVALVLGVLLLIPALGVLAGGGVLLWADTAGRNGDGYVLSPTDTFTTDGHVLVSERIDLSTGADWLPLSSTLGTARVDITGVAPSSDVFVGIAPVADASRYLDGVSGTVIENLGFESQAPNQHLLRGGPPSGPPGDQNFWITQRTGQGRQQISWQPADGDWMLVIMNADGSADVAVDARIGATVPALGGLAWGVLITGLLLTALAGLVIALAIRRRPAAAAPYGYAIPSAGPVPSRTAPPWTPPTGTRPPAARPPWTPPSPTDRTTAADATPDSTRSAHGGEPQP